MSTISEQDINTLDRFLQEHCEETNGFFSVEMLDGYLAALRVCAQPIAPNSGCRRSGVKASHFTMPPSATA